MTITRRQVLGSGAVALFLAGGGVRAATGETRIIPSSGERIPSVGLGSWITFNVGTDPVLLDARAEVIRAFAEEGGGMIDSSPMYGSSQGTIGHGLRTLPDRGGVFSADKVWIGSVPDGSDQIAESANAWGIETFDLLQVHNLVSWQGHLEKLFAMKAEGRLRYVGVTTSHGRRHSDLERVMARHPLDFVQLTSNLADREAEARLLPLAAERGIAVIVNRPYRRGALVRRLEGAPMPPFAADLGATNWPQLALKFILSHPAVTVAIPATTRVAHVRKNKRAARTPLPDADLRRRLLAHFQDV